MLSRIAPLFLLFGLITVASARPKCDRAAASVRIEDPYWNETAPILLRTSNGSELPLTFSIDTEIPNAEVFSKIYKDPQLFAELKEQTARPRLQIDDVATALRMSRKQFLSFAIRRGVVVINETILPTDLNAAYIGVVLNLYTDFFEIRKEVVQKWLGDLPITVGTDGANIEIRHRAFDTQRNSYKSLIEAIHTRVGLPQTHFHLGIPSNALSDEQFLAVARAIETRAILRLAVEDSDPDQKLSYSISYLYENNIEGKLDFRARGVVKAQKEAFEGLNPYHDLEFREWSTTEQAMDEMKLAINMVENASSLRRLHGQAGEEIDDPFTQNLPGALDYAGKALSYSTSEKVKAISAELTALSKQMIASKGATPAQRIAAATILSENRVLDLLDIEAFKIH